MRSTQTVHVPYKGSGPVLVGLLSVEVSVYFSYMVAAMGHVKNGRVRLFAVTSAERDRALPDTPTKLDRGIELLSCRVSVRFYAGARNDFCEARIFFFNEAS